MAVVVLVPTAKQDQYPAFSGGSVPTNHFEIPLVAGDTTDGAEWIAQRHDELHILNTDSVQHTYTVTSVPLTTSKRLGDMTGVTVPAGRLQIIKFDSLEGWAGGGSASDRILVTPSHALLLFAVAR